MSSVFDRLQKKLDLQMRDEGISALEIAELPPNLRKVMRLMLREVEMTSPALHAAVAEMADPINPADLEEALNTLSRQLWLIRRGEGERVTYQVNLRRKAGSKLAQGIWAHLENRITETKPHEKGPDQE